MGCFLFCFPTFVEIDELVVVVRFVPVVACDFRLWLSDDFLSAYDIHAFWQCVEVVTYANTLQIVNGCRNVFPILSHLYFCGYVINDDGVSLLGLFSCVGYVCPE